MDSKREKNQSAFDAKKGELSQQFPPEHYVAFDDGELVADASSFDELTEVLSAIGKDSPEVFVVQVGVEYPEKVFILL